ncbi:hypothetical protein A4X13_0g6968 [Tilletia indica]|uniref:Crossover junction endonuclease MUS81 n=1 Tax=Tilletia indica TaxID=43049 RepID=A0A177T4L7_9BASI|nr:hypothetical protein A4X13_0g6968 [Tilletia indica]
MPPRAAAAGGGSTSTGAGPDAAAEGPTSKTLWMAFLAEWATEASAKGSKACHAYTKASFSIKHADQDFSHPCELISLKGVGATIVQKLTERLEQWCVLHHQVMPQKPNSAASKGKAKATPATTTTTTTAAPRPAAASSSAPKRKRTAVGAGDRSHVRGSDDDLLGFGSGDNDSTDEDEQLRAAIAESLKDVRSTGSKDDAQPKKKAAKTSTAKAPKKSKAPAVPKAYVPNMRTGAYGILLGLLSQTPTIDDEVYMTKAQLIPLAQPWCDADYIVSSKASGPGSRGGSASSSRIPASMTAATGAAMHASESGRSGVAPPISYTAWSSMKTLVTKGLVYQTGNPPKYCLSEDGWELADQMKRVADSRPPSQSGSSVSPERPAERRQAATLPTLGTASGPSLPKTQSPVPQPFEPPVRARPGPSGLRIPVTMPGLFSSSDPPSSSPQQSFAAASSRTANPSDRKGKGKQTTVPEPEIVILSGDSTPEPDFGIDDDELTVLLTASQDTFAGSKARPQRAAQASSFHLPSAPTKKRANPFGIDTDTRVAQRSATWPQARASPLLDDFVDNSAPLPGSQQDVAIAISDSDDEVPPSRVASLPTVRLRQEEEIRDQTAAARPRGKHGRLSQALPRREVGALGLGWQAQIQAEIGTSQSQDFSQDDDDMVGMDSQATVGGSKATSARSRQPTAAKRTASFGDSDSDFDIEDIMRNVENGIAAKLGRAPEVGQLRKARAEAAASTARDSSVQASSPVPEDDLSDLEILGAPAPIQVRAEVDRKTSVPQSRTRPRDSLPAVPQPLLPGMAAVSVAADASFDMFDSAQAEYQERLLPPRAPTSTTRANAVASSSKGSSSASAANAPRKSTDWNAPTFSPRVWPAGSYDIILLLDTREIKHGSAMSTNKGTVNTMGVNATIRGPRCHLSDPLLEKGIPVEVRALELGDVVWIARRKGSAGTEEDEVVLDYIVERKRLDDLVQSIPDGRWKEQKFRLSLSGLSKVFYLIEDYDVEQQMRQWGPQIATAISSTQVIDGFFVQRTAGVDASLEWLRKMHQVICQTHQDKPLYVLPDHILSRPTYLRLQTHLRRTQPTTPHHITFASYRSLNAKNGSITVGEVWARMLLCVRGMSEEKVGEVIRVWSTGQDWWKACKAVGFQGAESIRNNVAAVEDDLNVVDDDEEGDALDDRDEFSFSDDSSKQASSRRAQNKASAGKKKATNSDGKNGAKKAIVGKGKGPTAKSSTAFSSSSATAKGKAMMADRVGGMYTSALSQGASRDATAVAASMAQYDSRKKIGSALSGKVWDLWTSQ